ncbi:hypothetical protein ACPDHL_05300 [Myroides sp. C15-4]|uniref:hypothetical protein n=1 Tax=Myroides sp. C15-4 TaxID=3400532 RepID=UPI003D2F8C4C
MERKVTLQEIEQLHRFVRQHYVEFYDVELELVDHLAHDIEAQWAKDATVSFEQALQIAFKKFGIFGFSDVVEQKINKLNSAYYKESFRLLKEFFTLPKIVVSVALFLVLYLAKTYLSQYGIRFVEDFFLGLGFLFIVVQMVKLHREKKVREKAKEKKWLLQSVLYNLEVWPYYFITLYVFRWILPRGFNTENTALSLLSVFILTVTVLYVYVLKAVVVPKVERDLNEQKTKIVTL